MPWLGFFNKAINCDVFVLLDTAQFEKNYFQNRNRILSSTTCEREWITVPVSRGSHTDLICEKQIVLNRKTKNRYLSQIQRSYSTYPFYRDTMDVITHAFSVEDARLSRLNIKLIKYFFDLLDIRCTVVTASDLRLGRCKPGGIINYHICKRLGASSYLSGVSGKDYLDEIPFKNDNIDVVYQEFKHPVYVQPSDTFVSHLSILDLVFSLPSDEARDVIKSGYAIKS